MLIRENYVKTGIIVLKPDISVLTKLQQLSFGFQYEILIFRPEGEAVSMISSRPHLFRLCA